MRVKGPGASRRVLQVHCGGCVEFRAGRRRRGGAAVAAAADAATRRRPKHPTAPNSSQALVSTHLPAPTHQHLLSVLKQVQLLLGVHHHDASHQDCLQAQRLRHLWIHHLLAAASEGGQWGQAGEGHHREGRAGWEAELLAGVQGLSGRRSGAQQAPAFATAASACAASVGAPGFCDIDLQDAPLVQLLAVGCYPAGQAQRAGGRRQSAGVTLPPKVSNAARRRQAGLRSQQPAASPHHTAPSAVFLPRRSCDQNILPELAFLRVGLRGGLHAGGWGGCWTTGGGLPRVARGCWQPSKQLRGRGRTEWQQSKRAVAAAELLVVRATQKAREQSAAEEYRAPA